MSVYQVCRGCLCSNTNLKNIFTSKDFEVTICEMLTACASVEVHEEDGFPTTICLQCYDKLVAFYAFRQEIRKADSKLRSKNSEMETSADVKQENVDMSCGSSVKVEDTFYNIIKEEDFQSTVVEQFPVNFVNADPLANDCSTTLQFTPSNLEQVNPTTPSRNDNLDTADNQGNIPTMTNLHIKEEYKCENLTISGQAQLDLDVEKHIEAKLFVCEVCNKHLNSRDLLNQHLLTHKDKKPYSCQVCEKTFRYPGALGNHVRSHTDDKPYKCDTCGKSFTIRSALTSHQLIHTTGKQLICAICNKPYKHKRSLIRHLKLHEGGEHLCPVCGRLFKNRRCVLKHMKVHASERLHSCKVCKKTYVTMYSLKMHMKVHAGIKDYVCKICSKAFTEPASLRRHIRVHSGEKPYACGKCSKKFSCSHHLRYHMKTHQRKVLW